MKVPKLSANLSTMFAEAPFEARFEAAAHAGFEAVEILFPYVAARELIAAQLRRHGLSCVLINMPAGDWQSGERGLACLPHRRDAFVGAVERAIDYACALSCPLLHCMAGVPSGGVSRARAHAAYVENLKRAADMLHPHGLTLTIEPINSHDLPGYLLNASDEAAEIIDVVGAPNLFLQYDVYHGHMMAEEPAAALSKHLSRIAHIQISDAPGRHEPGRGNIDFARLLPLIDEIGYENWVGCEYVPVGTTQEGLGWAAPYLPARRNKN